MKLDKNGYRSEKLDSFAAAVKVLTFIFGLGVVVAAVCVYAMFSGCGGGGSDSGTPIYGENGNCLNCSGNGDGYVSTPDNGQPSGDTPPTYADGKPIPQPDTEPYVCPVKEPPKICILYKDTYCAGFSLDGSLVACGDQEDTTNGHGCGCSVAHSPEQVNCKTDYECQLKPQNAWPPCVCWDFCGFFGEWDCGDGSIWNIVYLPDEGDEMCHMANSDGLNKVIGKPGDLNPRFPLQGTPNISYTLSQDGQTLTELTSGVTCTRL